MKALINTVHTGGSELHFVWLLHLRHTWQQGTTGVCVFVKRKYVNTDAKTLKCTLFHFADYKAAMWMLSVHSGIHMCSANRIQETLLPNSNIGDKLIMHFCSVFALNLHNMCQWTPFKTEKTIWSMEKHVKLHFTRVH